MKPPAWRLILAGVLLSACSSLNPFARGQAAGLKPSRRPGRDERHLARAHRSTRGRLRVPAGGRRAARRLCRRRMAKWRASRRPHGLEDALKTTVSGGVGSDGNPGRGRRAEGRGHRPRRRNQPEQSGVSPSTPRCWLRRRSARTAWSWCASPTTGCSVWIRGRQASALDLSSAQPRAALRNAAGVVMESNFIIAGFRGQAGCRQRRQRQAGHREGTSRCRAGRPNSSGWPTSPACRWSPRATCAVAYQGRVACFDMGNGNRLWTRDLFRSKGLDLDDRNVFVTDEGRRSCAGSRQRRQRLEAGQFAGRRPGRVRGSSATTSSSATSRAICISLRKTDGGVLGWPPPRRFQSDSRRPAEGGRRHRHPDANGGLLPLAFVKVTESP